MRLDSHQHFWQYSPVDHAWMDARMGAIKRDFMPRDLEPLLAAAFADGRGFDGCIAVQARQSLEETRWLLALAKDASFIRGVVGWVDLCSPELAGQLEEFAGNPKLAGVRHVVQDEPDDAFMLREDFRRGIARLREYGLTYDVLIYPKHLAAARRLGAEFPEQKFVLDHVAKPGIADAGMSPWREGIQRLAELPNVCCKLSGMVTEAKWDGWKADDFRPYLDVVMEAFGPERLMIGSDWPVCLLAADYATTVGLVVDYIGGLSDSEQAAILGGNCARVYGVGGVA